jgi:hypothetical protein
MPTCGNCKQTGQTIDHIRSCHSAAGYTLTEERPQPTAKRDAKPSVPLTEKQRSFLLKLSAAKIADWDGSAEQVAVIDRLSKSEASRAISRLLDAPDQPAKSSANPALSNFPDIPAGAYALEESWSTDTNGDGADEGIAVQFYKVDRPTEGRWAGRTFVKALFGAPRNWREEKLNFSVQLAVANKINKIGAEECARLFGQKSECCGSCYSPLSKQQSRAAGYGETCAGNNGFWYPTLAEAKVILQED